ncbi:ROK family transcriptional regulator [Arthrobacter sp. Soil762]|uniref:ROK family transcriptional regulator n=1 Tax=Arthrobacter sp. Soil762 TaxID=1736401 RepID=UPI0006F7631B|nr:ROK family transcriptional regulator [Arthrobacter sp. Soil762]KRE72703.1 MarR family transcriptional regulator [Arthrobacter sp. Soil762]
MNEPVAPGRVGDVRRRNLSLVLDSIARTPDAKPSRAQLSAATGLTKAAVSSLVADLVESGLVSEVGLYRDGERGRPGVGLELSTRRGVVGMEINVDYLSAGLLDLGGTLRIHRTLESGNRGQSPESVMSLLAGLVSDVAAEASAAGIMLLGGGLAVPGLVDSAAGTVATAPNLHWHGVALQLDRLLPDAPFGTVLHNEANCAALAELWYGHGLDFRDYLFISGEVGVGGGLVIGSELFAGPRGQAGEVGHMVVEPSGPDCSCGGHGCLESFAGQEAIFAEAGIAPGAASERLARLGEHLASGDPAALTAVARAGHYVGIAAASTARLMNLSAVVLGGHFTQMGPWIAPAVVESLADYAPGVVSPARVAVSELGQSAALLGAAGIALRSVLASPFSLTTSG